MPVLSVNTQPSSPRMAASFPLFESLGQGVGISLKHEHTPELLDTKPQLSFLEVHAENYMVAGGPVHATLRKLREIYPLSVHGVGLSIGGEQPLDEAHLNRLADVIARYEPQSFSEHLAWSTHDGHYLPDLFPLAYTNDALSRVCAHINQVQDTLKRRMLLENPSTYVAFTASSWDEAEFMREVIQRTGCGMLLDVNNVVVSCVNHGRDRYAYLEKLPLHAVGEIHLAGYAEEQDSLGERLLIDAHGTPVANEVWELYGHVLEHTGLVPTLIEWDNDVPPLKRLLQEADMAASFMRKRSQKKVA
jgi:uncharacterized protein